MISDPECADCHRCRHCHYHPHPLTFPIGVNRTTRLLIPAARSACDHFVDILVGAAGFLGQARP